MITEIINGRKVAGKIKEELKDKVAKLKKEGVTPSLATILVGDDPASKVYVRNKERFAGEIGVKAVTHRLSEEVEKEELVKLIESLNRDPSVSGILVQLPLPRHLPEQEIISLIDPKKDVDGFHPQNLGRILTKDPYTIPCTPFGIIRLLEEYEIPIRGKEAVCVGRSLIVGKPIALLLLERDATVTICHTKTNNLKPHTKRADILIVATGSPLFIKRDMIKYGSCVIDVGINRTPEGKLVGDVDFEGVQGKARWITPVPGGVGPMTVAMLLSNIVRIAERQIIKP